jgi:hypothetical protein
LSSRRLGKPSNATSTGIDVSDDTLQAGCKEVRDNRKGSCKNLVPRVKKITPYRRGSPLRGAVLTVQTKASGSTKWLATTTTVTVAADGTYSTPFAFGTAVKESIGSPMPGRHPHRG